MTNQQDVQAAETGTFSGEEEGGGMALDLKALLLYGVGRSWIWVLLLFGLGAAGGVLVAAAQPNIFRSSGLLRLTSGKREMITPETTFGIDENRVSPAMSDELLLLSDIAIYESVAEDLGPDAVLSPSDPTRWDTPSTPLPLRWLHQLQKALLEAGRSEQTTVQAAGQYLKDNTSLWADRHSSVISVSFTATDPDRAREMAQILMDAFIERHRDAYSIGGYLEANRQERLQAVDAQARAEETYHEHVELCGYVDLEGQTETLLETIGTLDRDLRSKKAALSGVQALRADLVKRREEIPQTKPRVTPAVLGKNPEYEAYEKLVYEIQAQKVRLNDPSISIQERELQRESLNQQLEDLRQRMSAIPVISEKVPEFRSDVLNPEYEQLGQRIAELEANESGLIHEIESLQDSLKAKQEQLGNAQRCQRTHAILEREIADRRQDFERLSSATTELEVLAQLEAQGDSNLRLFQPAALPQGKVGPKRSKMVAVGVALGLFLGVGLAVLRQFLDSRVRYPRTLEREFGLPVIGVLPEVAALSQKGAKRAAREARQQPAAEEAPQGV